MRTPAILSTRLVVSASAMLATAIAMPALANATPTAAPTIATHSLAGSKVALYALQDGRLPRVWYHLYLDAGERYVPARQEGIVSVAAQLLERGPADVPYAHFRDDRFREGVEVHWEAGNRFLIAHVKCRPDQLARVTRLVRHTVEHPKLDATTFKQVLDNALNQRRSMNDSMNLVTFNYGKQRLWDFRPEARQPEGWVESLQTLAQADLAAYFRGRVAHPAGFVAAVAPVPAATVAQGIAPALAGWMRPATVGRAPYPATLPPRRAILIDKPGATDNQIYALSPLPMPLTSPQAAAAEVFFAGMGYDLGSRLGNTLRVKRGLTYGANSGVRRVEWPQWYAYSFGGITQTPKIVSGIFELFDAAKGGLTGREVAIAKSELLQGYAADMESPAQQLDAVAAAVAQGLPPDYPFQRPRLIERVQAADLKPAARLAVGLPHATIVVMGDASKIKAPVAAALPPGTPLEVRELNELGPEALKAAAATKL